MEKEELNNLVAKAKAKAHRKEQEEAETKVQDDFIAQNDILEES